MKWFQVSVGPVPARISPLNGVVAECPDCGRREWWVFMMPPSKRVYLQCAKCDRVEAADGQPSAELDAYALADAVDDGPLHPMTVPGQEVPG